MNSVRQARLHTNHDSNDRMHVSLPLAHALCTDPDEESRHQDVPMGTPAGRCEPARGTVEMLHISEQ